MSNYRRTVGLTHYECEVCGCLLEELPADYGFVPEQAIPRVLRKASDRNQLGTRIDESGGSDRVSRAHSQASSKRVLFIDIAIGELVRECGVCPASVDAAHLLHEADSVSSLGRIRRKMRGAEGMEADESGNTGLGPSQLVLCTSGAPRGSRTPPPRSPEIGS